MYWSLRVIRRSTATLWLKTQACSFGRRYEDLQHNESEVNTDQPPSSSEQLAGDFRLLWLDGLEIEMGNSGLFHRGVHTVFTAWTVYLWILDESWIQSDSYGSLLFAVSLRASWKPRWLFDLGGSRLIYRDVSGIWWLPAALSLCTKHFCSSFA